MNHLKICLVLGLLLAVAPPATRARAELQNQDADCQRDFRGIEYCLLDDGRTRVVRIDLTNRQVRFDVATASNATGPNPPSWYASYRQTVADMAEDHRDLAGSSLAVAVTADYGAGDGSHGWQGLLVQQGQRRDGPSVNAPDCDCGSSTSSAITFSQSKPVRVEIGPRSPEELAEYHLYAANCRGSLAFQGCESTFLQRTPAPDEQERYDARLDDEWYTAVGGGPVIVRNGQPIPISQACREEQFAGDWCSDNPNVSPDRLRQLRMGSVAGLSADGRTLILIVTTERLPNDLNRLLAEQGADIGIRFDGSESAQMWYDGNEWTGNTRRISNALLVYAEPLPENFASPTSALFYDVVVAGEMAELDLEMRNEGRLTWNPPAYELVSVGGNLPGAPSTLSPAGAVATNMTERWHIQAPTSGAPGVRSVRYQMHHNGEPFGDTVTGYVFVLPKELKDLEQQIRDQIAQWQQQGQQTVEELIKQIGDLIAQAVAQQAQGLIDKLLDLIDRLLAQCTGSISLAGFAIAVVIFGRRARSGRRRR